MNVANDLTISGGNSVAIATDELHDLAQRLEATVHILRRARATIGETSARGLAIRAEPELGRFNAEAQRALEATLSLLAECEFRADSASRALRGAAVAYGVAEDSIDASMRRLAGMFGYGIGLLSPVLISLVASFAVTAIPGVLLGAGILRLWELHDPRSAAEYRDGIGAWWNDQRGLLTNPVTVALVSNLLTSSDDLVAGAFMLPPALVELFGDDGLALTGISSSALVAVVAGGTFGLLVEGRVSATRTTTRTLDRAPVGLAERVERLPSPGSNANGEQIRIDRFSAPGQPDRFEVFIAGTVDFSAVATDEPFDLTSNIHSVAQLPAGSDRAVREAMAHAGIQSSSPVIFTGHSQGGMIAANLAASGDFATKGVLTIGAPDGAIVIAPGIPVISIAHTDDLVTVLNGPRRDAGTIVVEREAFAQRAIPNDIPLPAHDRGEYRETAARADRAAHANLARTIASFDRMTSGTVPVSTSLYLARRNQSDAS